MPRLGRFLPQSPTISFGLHITGRSWPRTLHLSAVPPPSSARPVFQRAPARKRRLIPFRAPQTDELMKSMIQVRRTVPDRLPVFVVQGGHADVLGDVLVAPL